MKFKPKPLGEDAVVDWTPMIDVTFQLIAFFMFTLNLSNVDTDQAIKLPASELAKPTDQPFTYPITAQLRADGVVLLSGQEYTMDAFRIAMLNLAAVQERLRKSPSEVTVIVRADSDAPTGRVQEVIRKCQEARFEDFVLRARQTQTGS